MEAVNGPEPSKEPVPRLSWLLWLMAILAVVLMLLVVLAITGS